MTNLHWILALQELYPFFRVFTHSLKSDFLTFSFSLFLKSASIRTKLCIWGFLGMRNWFEVVSVKYFKRLKRYWHFFEFSPLYTHGFTCQFWFWLSSNTFLHHSTWYSGKTEFVVAVSAEIPYYHSHKSFCFFPQMTPGPLLNQVRDILKFETLCKWIPYYHSQEVMVF